MRRTALAGIAALAKGAWGAFLAHVQDKLASDLYGVYSNFFGEGSVIALEDAGANSSDGKVSC